MSEEIKKDDSTQSALSPELQALLDVSKAQSESIEKISKSVEGLTEKIEKMADANPVEHGTTVENKPKVSDGDDVGDKAKTDPSYAPQGDAQASNSAPAGEPQKPDSVSKSDDEKKPEEKKEEAKPEEKKDDDVKKSYSPDRDIEYAMIKSTRPKYNVLPTAPEHAPTAAQILDQINKGWDGKYTNYYDSFLEAMNRLEKGEFGTGSPDGGNF